MIKRKTPRITPMSTTAARVAAVCMTAAYLAAVAAAPLIGRPCVWTERR
jgi:hypothetical protein